MKKIAGIFLLLFSAINCTNNTEPAFTVRGDTAVMKDLIVNIEMLKDNGTFMATTYYDGKNYDINNQGVIRYTIYVSYKNRFFYKTEMDNLHYKFTGEPINEIIIQKKDSAITASYRPLKKRATITGTTLQANVPHEAIEKQKFTGLYQTK